MCVLVGYGEFSKKVLRIKYLPRIVVYESAHVTLLENIFPFKAKPERPISSFLTEEQQRWLELGDNETAEAAVPSRGRGRPPSSAGGVRSQRQRTPSLRAIEGIPDVDSPPEQFTEAHFNKLLIYDVDRSHFDQTAYYTKIYDEAFPEAWATIGGAEEHRNYYKLITESPHKTMWKEALAKEWPSHHDLKTMSEPINPKDLPPGIRPIPFDLIGKVKRDGTYKCRGIVKGYHMREGIDYNETFATVPCPTTLRFFFNYSAYHDWDAWQGDVTSWRHQWTLNST